MKEPLFTKKDIIMTSCAALLIICIFVFGCGRSPVSEINEYVGLKDDNIIESNLENLIESHLGFEIDLTPENPDNDEYSLDIWREDK